MSPGAKVFLTIASLGGVLGVLALAASKKANAAPKGEGGTVVVPPHDGLPPTVTPSEPEGGFDRSGPFAVPGVQDAAEASQLLQRWWGAEGASLVSSDTASDRPSVPNDFGMVPSDQRGAFDARAKAAAAAFQHYGGLTPEDGVLTNALLLALRRWAASQALPPQALPPASTPLGPLPPMVLPSSPVPSSLPQAGPPLTVPLPPIMPQSPPIVPVPPFIPNAAPPASTPPIATPPVVAPNPLPPGPLPVPPVLTNPLPPQSVPQGPPAPATTVAADTAAMVNALLLREGSAGWNAVDPAVQAWQKPRGLKVDGLFGPKTALAVAEEFGTVPIIRVWPSGSSKAPALQAYRASLIEIANHATDPTRAAQLRVSSQREQAQGFGPKRGTAPAIAPQLRVALEKVA